MKYKTLLCLTSYRRPYYVAFQITRLLALEKKYDISVSIKGISEYEFRNAFFAQWEKELKSGRLKIYFDANKGQLSNFLDSLRRDYDAYDLFAKIDDDDFYLDRYFEEMESYYDNIKELPWLTNSPRLTFFIPKELGAMGTGRYHLRDSSGPTLVLSRDFVRHTLAFECNSTNPVNLPAFEDAFLVKMAREHDSLDHRYGTEREDEFHSVFYNNTNPSCMRGNYLSEDHRKIYQQQHFRNGKKESLIYAIHPHWSSALRIFGEELIHLNNKSTGRAILLNDYCLIVKWDNYNEETFLKKENGAFYLAP